MKNLSKLIKSSLLILSILLISQSTAFAQIDTIRVQNGDLNMHQLEEGTSQYLVYLELPNGRLLDASIWERTVIFQDFKGTEALVVTQTWKNQNPEKVKTLYSVNDAENFSPIFHKTQDKETLNAFDFYEDKIVGSDTVEGIANSDFSLDIEEIPLNWELDMEILSTLPYSSGKEFYINFYHPGSETGPKYYKYEVVREETLLSINNMEIDTWVLKIEYSAQNHAEFWISKDSYQFIQMIESAGPMKRYKKLLG